jgi:hypothetical protein
MVVWYSLWSFGIFFHFGTFGPRKIWQPWPSNAAVRRRKRDCPIREGLYSRVARWYIFIPKNKIWVNLGGWALECNCIIYYGHFKYYTAIRVCNFYGHLVYFVVMWYIFTISVCSTKKNLANLLYSSNYRVNLSSCLEYI